MATRRFTPSRSRRTPEEIDAVMRDAAREARKRRRGYRAQSLALHGWICARCAREFERDTLHLLTVHHRDGNHENNPPDGSNWENLCVYCHDAEHSKDELARYVSGDE